MKKNYFKKIIKIGLLAILFFVMSFSIVGAKGAGSVIQNSINNTAKEAQLSDGGSIDLSTFVGSVVKNLLGLLGTVFFVLVLYAGFMWMTAGGNEEKITKAKKILSNSFIGLVIVILAYAIVGFVLKTFIESTAVPSVQSTSVTSIILERYIS